MIPYHRAPDTQRLHTPMEDGRFATEDIGVFRLVVSGPVGRKGIELFRRFGLTDADDSTLDYSHTSDLMLFGSPLASMNSNSTYLADEGYEYPPNARWKWTPQPFAPEEASRVFVFRHIILPLPPLPGPNTQGGAQNATDLQPRARDCTVTHQRLMDVVFHSKDDLRNEVASSPDPRVNRNGKRITLYPFSKWATSGTLVKCFTPDRELLRHPDIVGPAVFGPRTLEWSRGILPVGKDELILREFLRVDAESNDIARRGVSDPTQRFTLFTSDAWRSSFTSPEITAMLTGGQISRLLHVQGSSPGTSCGVEVRHPILETCRRLEGSGLLGRGLSIPGPCSVLNVVMDMYNVVVIMRTTRGINFSILSLKDL